MWAVGCCCASFCVGLLKQSLSALTSPCPSIAEDELPDKPGDIVFLP